MAVLRQRRGAIDRRRARVHIDHVGIERAVDHLPALAGIGAKPAARRDGGALLDADRGFHAVAGAVAQRQFRVCRERDATAAIAAKQRQIMRAC